MTTLRGSDFLRERFEAHRSCSGCPSPERVARWFDGLLTLLFPDLASRSFESLAELEVEAERLEGELAGVVARIPEPIEARDAMVPAFFRTLPSIVAHLEEDVSATFEGDPAAVSRSEVVRSYPGFHAIAAYRVAHALHRLGLPIVPRMITELAHGRTGIDIHPAALIGRYFCIDHGTGVVIGETAEIGDRVKLYQGVTLGAMSVRKGDARTKRHPTIESDVVVYAGATILGGATRIGQGSTIGGNVWLTRSVPANTTLHYQERLLDAGVGETATPLKPRGAACD
ncbi:MAG: serine acetyltransferase [Trueperaceae bacterium]|nr:serine acetyltransferase [Trueperaceae bacterium]